MLWSLRALIHVSPVITVLFIFRGEVVPVSGVVDSDGLLTVTLFVMATCIALFALRERYRLYYGLLELIFAFLLIWNAAVKIGIANGAIVAGTTFGNDALFALCAAIYVGVRALDNLGQALERYPSTYRMWLWLFLYPDDEAEAKVEAATQKQENRAKSIRELVLEGSERPIRKFMPPLDLSEQKKNIPFPWQDVKAKSPQQQSTVDGPSK